MSHNLDKNGIAAIALKGISRIQEKSISEVLNAVYNSTEVSEIAQVAQGVFDKLISRKWPHDKLSKFMSGWRATHGTALFVSGLIVRIHRKAAETHGKSADLLYRAAAELSEIISEDTGVDDTPHNELFVNFADMVVGDDDWKLGRFTMSACEGFRDYVKKQRLEGSIAEAILTTAASENWNTGEYSYFTFFARDWLIEVLNIPQETAVAASAYVEGHSGETELGHFLHAIKAWILYCEATSQEPDLKLAQETFERYIKATEPAYRELAELLL